MARIAILGWGSLIWDPGEHAIASRWHADGPCLPIEFARKSGGMRVTLVIVPRYEHLSRTYWALSAFGDVGAAAQNLREREGCPSLKPIHAADGETWRSVGDGKKPDDRVGRTISEWVSGRDDCRRGDLDRAYAQDLQAQLSACLPRESGRQLPAVS